MALAAIAVVGALLTLLTIGLLLLGGYLAALWVLEVRRPGAAGAAPERVDLLRLAVATLVLATGQAVAIALVLGFAGLLRIELALALQAVLCLVAARLVQRSWPPDRVLVPARNLARAVARHTARRPVLALVAVHAAGSEILRGLLRPPLSWDSVLYHLLFAGRWLQEQAVFPLFGPDPISTWSHWPANGSLWLWWWMAPSHSELYVNLAALPHWLLLGLAAGGVARELGARERWPLAAFLVLLVPAVVRFVATQYMDLLVGAMMVSALFLAVRWLEPLFTGGEGAGPGGSWGDAAIAGIALGVAGGTKVLAAPYAAGMVGLVVVLAALRWREWRQRVPQLLVAGLLLVLLGGAFYARNLALGAGPLALRCESSLLADAASGEGGTAMPALPRADSVAANLGTMLGQGVLVEAVLGTRRPPSLELGIGPQAVLLPLVLLLPWAVGRGRRWAAFLVLGYLAVELALWVSVPFSLRGHVFANFRYLDGSLALAFAGCVVLAERVERRQPDRFPGRWVELLAVALAIQDLLMLHATMPFGARVTVALLDLAAVAWVASRRLRRSLVHRPLPWAAAALVVVLVIHPPWVSFRLADRGRAFAEEFTVHATPMGRLAGAWSWLDENAGEGPVAMVMEPSNLFVYPVMGPYLERRALYVNHNEADHGSVLAYPGCDPRVAYDPDAWLANLAERGVRWVMLSRFSGADFPVELEAVREHPERFEPVYSDPRNLVFRHRLPGEARPQLQ